MSDLAPPDTDSTQTLRSITLMIVAMAGFALADLGIAVASDTLPAGQIMAMMGAGAALTFWGIAKARGMPVRWHLALRRPVLIRNGAEIVGTFGMVQALGLMPIASLTAILQVTPLAVMLGAAVILREAIGWRRWAAVLVGFVGVLIMVRPADGISTGALLALLGVLGLALRDVVTRLVPREIHTLELAVFGFATLLPLGLITSVSSGMVAPDGRDLALIAGIIVFAALGYFCVTASLRIGDVSAVTPFRYTRFLFATLLGLAVLGQRPDAPTLLGGALVIGAGLYALMRERARVSNLKPSR